MKRYIAIDFGAESGRFIVGTFDETEKKLQMEEIYRFKTQGTPFFGNLRWNVLRFWEEILAGLRKYHEIYGNKADGIGIDSWGVSLVALNLNDELLYTPFHYRAEIIADPILDNFKKELGEDYIFNITGIQFMSLNSSTHLFATQKKFPDMLDRAQIIFMIPDFFMYLLTGKKITEYTNASTTQLLDVKKRQWSKDFLDKLSIKNEIFPPLTQPGTRLGRLLSSVQDLTGLEEIPVHVVATHDTASAIAAIPHIDQSATWAYLSSGTWSLLGVEIPEPIVNPTIQKYNLTNEGGVDGTIRLLKNIMGLWLIQECKREWDLQGESLDYAQIASEAERAPPFKSFIYPDDPRFFSPKSMVQAIQSFCQETNQSVPQTKGEHARCIFESLACRYREVIEICEELTGTKIQQIHIVGGGSKNTLLSKMTANATQRLVTTGPVEATAIGNLLMQAKSAGELKNLHEIRQVVHNSFDIEEIPPESGEVQNSWEKAYQKYKLLTTSGI
jgi:rhamnulokinase